MVGEYVCPFLVWEAILAVRYHVLWNPLHVIHRTQPAYWILNKEVFGLQSPNQLQSVFVNLVTIPCIVGDGI